jgi:GNAT superfamily N-acetyltransferase
VRGEAHISMPGPRISIRKATEKDLVALESWLRAEHEQTGEGFYCNWGVITEAFKRKDLAVLAAGGDVLGFVADAPGGADIVEVRPDMRGRGYGRRLAEWVIDGAFRRGNSVIAGECAPASSVPFWTRMGYEISSDRTGPSGGIYAYKLLERRFTLNAGPRFGFGIAFCPNARDWDKKTKPFREYTGEAEGLKDDSIQLPERAICFAPDIRNTADCVVCITVDGRTLFEDKVKRPEAKSLGVCSDPGGVYFLDKIFPPSGARHLFGGPVETR